MREPSRGGSESAEKTEAKNRAFLFRSASLQQKQRKQTVKLLRKKEVERKAMKRGRKHRKTKQSPSLRVLEQLLPQNAPVRQYGQEAGEEEREGAASGASDREEKNGADFDKNHTEDKEGEAEEDGASSTQHI
ncbi:hypothetical protein SRHO_G00160280 [Serrasalmus rhombeus]